MKRYAAIWFRHLATDWLTYQKPERKNMAFVIVAPDHGRLKITSSNPVAERQGITPGMVVADAKAILPDLKVIDEDPLLNEGLLKRLGLYCIRFTPIVSVDHYYDGLILNVTGCTHLWKGEETYLNEIENRLKGFGFNIRIAVADTIGTAWAIARYGTTRIVAPGKQVSALLPLPPAALRLEPEILDRLSKLGFKTIGSFMNIPTSTLRRRFGKELLIRLNEALGNEEEYIRPVIPIEPYEERLQSIEPISTATGIEIALTDLLEKVCIRLKKEGKGIRKVNFKCYCIDGRIEQISSGTNRPTYNIPHLLSLFKTEIQGIEPRLGIELFILEAIQVEDASPEQEELWGEESIFDKQEFIEMLDRVEVKFGAHTVYRCLPQEHHWPERSIKTTTSLHDKPQTDWRKDRPRPVDLLGTPQPIEVSAGLPDYPPILFRYQNKVYHIKKADAAERIEREWWLDEGEHRDYYYVEDQDGARYWIFRSGHYTQDTSQWFIHGFFG